MISDIYFKNFRGLRNLEMKDLEQITLISGKNNAGKTSLLEGVFLLFDHVNPESFAKLTALRGLPVINNGAYLWEPIFTEQNLKQQALLQVRYDKEDFKLTYEGDTSYTIPESSWNPLGAVNQFVTTAPVTTLRFSFSRKGYNESGHFFFNNTGSAQRHIQTDLNNNNIIAMPGVTYINSIVTNGYTDNVLSEWIGKLELNGEKQKVMDSLRLLEPSVNDITTIIRNGQGQLYVTIGSQKLPLKLAGDGMNRLLYLTLAILCNPGSVLLIDEIETGFHYSMYSKLWEVIALAARENHCQIIATTHSYECIDCAIEGIDKSQMSDNFCFYRLEYKNGKNQAFHYRDNLLASALQSNLEVR